MKNRERVLISVRLDKRIVDQLNTIAESHPKTRNFIIEQMLGERCGLPYYDWKQEDEDNESDY